MNALASSVTTLPALQALPAEAAPPPRLRRYQRHGMVTQLMALEAVVRLGSATHAAQSLCMAQPTLSGHLRKLSDALDVRLFDMQGKRLVPTPAALVLLEGAREVFSAFERCEARLAQCRPAGAMGSA